MIFPLFLESVKNVTFLNVTFSNHRFGDNFIFWAPDTGLYLRIMVKRGQLRCEPFSILLRS